MGVVISLHPLVYLLFFVANVHPSSCITTLEAGPENRTVFAGETTSLICDFSDDNENPILWARVDSLGIQQFVSHGNIISPNTGADPSDYDIIIDDDKQTYELMFNDVKESLDGALYQCGYQYEQTLRFRPLASAYLTVLPQEYSFTCQYHHLPPPISGTGVTGEIEITCVFNRDVNLQVELYLNGGKVDADLQFPDRVISRVTVSSDGTTIDAACKAVIQENGFTVTATETCVNSYSSNDRGVIRVDPFINEVPAGSDAVFQCTKGEQSDVQVKFWNIVNMTQSFLTGGQTIDNRTEITIPDVQTEDEILLIECRAILSGSVWVSSFAAIRVASITTFVPASRGRTDQITISTTHFGVTMGVTRSTQTSEKSKKIIIALIIIFLIIVIVVALIIFLIRRKRDSQAMRSKSSANHSISYGTNVLQDVPHVAPNGGTQIYALPIKDKHKRREGTEPDGESYQGNAQEFTAAASSDGLHSINVSTESVDDLKEPIGMFRSLPILNDMNYEMMSMDGDLHAMQRTKSMTTIQSNPSGRRGTSQKWKRSTLRTPPRGRRVLSYNTPTFNSDPNVSTNYTEMSIRRKQTDDNAGDDNDKQRSVPVYAKPDKFKKTNLRFASARYDAQFSPSTTGSLKSTHSDAGRFKKKDLKGTSLHGPCLTSQAPPKPSRGKCQSQFINPTPFIVVSDYEIMAKQVQNSNPDEDNPTDDQGQVPNYDKPRPSVVQKPPRRDRSPSGVKPRKPSRGNSLVRGNSFVRPIYAQIQDKDLSNMQSGDHVKGPDSPDYAEIDDVLNDIDIDE